MALNQPSKKEVMGWNPQTLAEYLRRLSLTGCDKIVLKGNITGAEFMKMTSRDIQVFPVLFRSLITKIQRDLNKEEQKTFFDSTSNTRKYAKQVFVQENNQWESEKFNNKSNKDYDLPDQDEEDGYINPLTDSQTAMESDKSCGDPDQTFSKPKLPPPPRINHSYQRPLHIPGTKPTLQIDRSKKPGQPGHLLRDFREGSTVKGSASCTSKFSQPMTPNPKDVPNRARKVIAPPERTLKEPDKVHIKSTPVQSLDPNWYVGKITRDQAELALKKVNKDGAFLVRESSKGFAEHPYTLMLLKKGRIYNIKIRNQGNSYLLGTQTMSFPGVKEMITHHTQIPLLLIDATDQSSTRQNMCCLQYPAGL